MYWICHFNVLFSQASQQVLLIPSFARHIVSVARWPPSPPVVAPVVPLLHGRHNHLALKCGRVSAAASTRLWRPSLCATTSLLSMSPMRVATGRRSPLKQTRTSAMRTAPIKHPAQTRSVQTEPRCVSNANSIIVCFNCLCVRERVCAGFDSFGSEQLRWSIFNFLLVSPSLGFGMLEFSPPPFPPPLAVSASRASLFGCSVRCCHHASGSSSLDLAAQPVLYNESAWRRWSEWDETKVIRPSWSVRPWTSPKLTLDPLTSGKSTWIRPDSCSL